MSKGTSAASPWSGSRWARTRAAPPPRPTVNRTARCRAASLVAAAALALAGGCARESPAERYAAILKSYRRGDLAQALSAAKQQAARFAASDPHWHWEFRLLTAEALTGLARFAEARSLVAEDPPASLPVERTRAWIDRAQLALSRPDDAASLLRQARTQAAAPELAIRVNLVEGNLEASRGRPARAEELYRAALEIASRDKDAYYQANALNNISVARRRQNHYEDSLEYGLRAVAAADAAGALRMAAAAHESLGTSYSYLGQFESALEHDQQAVQMDQAMGLRDAAMSAIGQLGLIYHRADRFAEAVPQHERAFALATELGIGKEAARFAENLAVSLVALRQWDAAEQWNDRAFDLAKRSGADSTLPFLLRNRAEIALARGNPEEAAAICRGLLRSNARQPNIDWEAHHFLAQTYVAARRYPDANREFEAALRDIEASRTDVLDPRYRVTLLSRLISFYRSYVDSLVRQGADAKALAVADSSRARVLSERLGRDVAPARLADAAALRGLARTSGVSVLAFWLAPARSFAWLIARDRVRRFDLPPAAEIESLVTDYRQVVEHSVSDPMASPAGRALWEKLLAPVARELPPGARVVVVPDGALHRLNLETLPVPGPAPHYWLEDVELEVAPSVSLAMAAQPPERAPRSLLLIGAPDYAGSGYDPLPGAAAEVEELRKRFAAASPDVITGKQAFPAAYRSAGPGQFSLIHFAAHAEANAEKPLESAVVLSRSGDSRKLYASDVIDVPIHADLVTLSACRGAGARAYAGEGLMGFAWAFLHAGARAVVAGLWDVPDGVTAPLMGHFYDGILAKRPPADALREAKLCLLRETRYRRPFYWAAFQTYR